MKSGKLKRSIGLVSATSIGLGAMLGAGIFVFPGLAGGDVGLFAIISFLIGGIIALSVAACTAELATAMPNSGGGYFYVSRTFGSFWGTLTGISQWIGLVFACSFYLVSFAEYTLTFLEELKITWSSDKKILSIVFTLFLLLINIIGTKKVGRFQNLMVISLTVILVLVFSYGLVDFFGLEDEPLAFRKNPTTGILSVFSTTALIFTSYLGFVQIANVGAEIKDPDKNLPRSLIWSVVIAMGLYIFVMVTCISAFSQEELNGFGETATIEVAREMLGNWGAIVIVFAGLLAALSSANASMISASRGVFALSNDQLISTKANDVNKRFGTPHIALILVALPVGVILLRSKLEVFAEVASFLHLIIYAGICLSLLKLRASNPIWFIPTFRVPAIKIVAGSGAIGCVVLMFFMRVPSILISLGILIMAAAYYFLKVKKKEVKLDYPQPKQIDARLIHPKVLIPIDVTHQKKDLPRAILEAIPISEILLLGFKETPEQSQSEQSEKKFGEAGKKKLQDIEKKLQEEEINYESELIFSDKIRDQIKQIIEDEELHFILTLKPISDINQLVIPLYNLAQINKQLITVIYNIYSNYTTNIKVLLFIEDKKNSSGEPSLKREMERKLNSVGIHATDYQVEPIKKPSPENVLRDISGANDLIIFSETKPSQRKFILDLILENNTANIASPSIVILNKENNNSG